MSANLNIPDFIDLEAEADNDEHEPCDATDTDSDDFVYDISEYDTNTRRAPRWQEMAQWEGDSIPVFWETIAQARTDAYPPLDDLSAHETPEEVERLLPSYKDYIWQVRVKDGWESDVVLAIMQKALAPSSKHTIRSAFYRDSIACHVYVEADSVVAVSSVLDRIPGVASTKKGAYAIDLIDLHDRILLLDTGIFDGRLPVSEHSWVRVRGGLYKGDLALIHHIEKATLMCGVYLVPRLSLGRKRRRGRPPKSLFNEELARNTCGAASVEKHNDIIIFRGDTYQYRFLRASIHIASLLTKGINVHEDELDFFRQEIKLWTKVDTFISPIKVGDRVRVVSGALIGRVGNIVSMTGVTVKLGHADEPRAGTKDVLIKDVQKDFTLGDFVQIIHGHDRGISGFVVQLNHPTAVLYTRVVTAKEGYPCEMPGMKLAVNVENLEWKATPEHWEKPPAALPHPQYGAQTTASHGRQPSPEPSTASLNDKTTALDESYKHHAAEAQRMTPNSGRKSDAYTHFSRYRHMEVSIYKGDAKGHFGVVKGIHIGTVRDIIPSAMPSAEKDMTTLELLFDVMTTTRTINTCLSFRMQDLRERYTHLPLDKACWIPERHRLAIRPQAIFPPKALTPVYEQERSNLDEHNLGEDAVEKGGPWDARSQTPPPVGSWPPEPEEHIPGLWLLDPRLTTRKLDVRIQGTKSAHLPWQNGKFEGLLGFVVLTSAVSSTHISTIVKTGYAQNHSLLQIRHLVPETTTERPMYRFTTHVPPPNIYPVLSIAGSRVVIIGPDDSNCRDYIGDYALVVVSPYPLLHGHGLVQIASPGPNWGRHVYISSTSICRSDISDSPIDWFGTRVG